MKNRKDKKKIQHVQFEKKKGARKFNTRAQACAERDKKMLNAKWNKRGGVLGSRPYPATLHSPEEVSEISWP